MSTICSYVVVYPNNQKLVVCPASTVIFNIVNAFFDIAQEDDNAPDREQVSRAC